MTKQAIKKPNPTQLEIDQLRIERNLLKGRLERELANIAYLEEAIEKYQKLIHQLVMDICPKVSR